MFFSGNKVSGQGGVGVWLSKSMLGSLLGYKPINGRLMSIRLQGTVKNLKIVQVYAPTSKATQEELDEFYTDLQTEIDNTHKKDIVMVMGDFNAKVGSMQDLSEKGIIGRYAYGSRNENGEQLVDFALGNGLKMMNTTFHTHPRRLYTWTEPDGVSKHQLDYTSIQQEHP